MKVVNYVPLRLLLMMLLGMLAFAGLAQDLEYPELSITATPTSIEGPDTLEAGFYRVAVTDESGMETDISIARLNEGATAEEVLTAIDAMVAAFASEGGSAEAEEQVFSLVTLVGGASMPNDAIAELTPGEYLIVSVGANEQGQSHTSMGLQRSFTVTEAAAEATAPEADLTVDMLEFAFTIPDEVPAGEQTWEVQNVGEQPHHLVLMKVQEGMTIEDVMSFMQAPPDAQGGPPPFEEAGYVNILSPDQRNFVTFDLEAGSSYVALCFITDPETGMPHVALGMIDTFTVPVE